MKLIDILLVLVISISAPVAAIAQSSTGQTPKAAPDPQANSTSVPAPFGLSWGATKAETEKVGIVLTARSDESNGPAYMATNLPKTISDVESVALYFGFGDRLYKVAAFGKTYENDPYGTQVRSRYDELVKILEQKYGPGQASDFAADFYHGDNWTYGLMKKENWHYTDFESGGVSVQISCRSVEMNDSYWIIIYENESEAKIAGEARKKHEAGAL